jgi:hypothetical protein
MDKIDPNTYHIRRDIQAPEVDTYDSVPRKHILEREKKLHLFDRVSYRL